MKAHLLNWVIGPAFLGAVVASFGCDPQPVPPSLGEWLDALGALAPLAVFFAAGGLTLTVIMVVAQRLIEGRFIWAEVRVFAIVMAVKAGLLVFVLAILFSTYLLAVTVVGGWQGGWYAAAIGGAVGAAMGLPAGLG